MLRNIFTTLTIAFAAMLLTLSAHANFLEDEAGITAYTNVGRAINLSAVKNAFRTIEHETADYVIGSVAIPDYTESEDVHVYIHKDGWLAAYYLKDEPVAKIIDSAHYEGGQISGTKLDLALLEVSNALGLPIVDVKYYDFVAPQANQLLLVVDRQDQQEDSFEILIPNDLTVFERSWVHHDRDRKKRIVIESANATFRNPLTATPTELPTDIAPRMHVGKANASFRIPLEATPSDLPSEIAPRVHLSNANATLRLPMEKSPSELEQRADEVGPRTVIVRANATFRQPLAPMDPAITDLSVARSGSSANLTWTKQRAAEFPNTLVVSSQKPILWRPEAGVDYTTGDVIEENIVVNFVGDADHATTPLAVSGLDAEATVHFAIFPFNAEKRYWVGAYASAFTEGGGPPPIGTYEIALQKGLNFISLPVDTEGNYSAADLVADTGATLVLRYDAANQKFVAYVPEVPGDEFLLKGGEGYIVNMLEPKPIRFTGTVWNNVAAAPSFEQPQTVWAFAVAGQIAPNTPTEGMRVTVSNRRTNWQVDGRLRSTGGRFTLAFADMSRRAIVEAGDTLEIRVTDTADHLFYTAKLPVTDSMLREARLILPTLRVQTTPDESVLLPNFPNPFNPETWIPYTLAEASEVTIRIYDTVGREVRVLSLGFQPAGWYDTKVTAVYWNGRNTQGERVSSGIYWIVMEAGTSRQIRRSVVLK